MTEGQATVHNEHGIHCRPSSVIMKAVKGYEGDIRIVAESGETDLRSIYGLLSLGLEKGATVTIQVDGPDEEAVCRQLEELFEKKFDFPPRN